MKADFSERFWLACAFWIFAAIAAYALLIGAPAEYPVGQTVIVPAGSTIADAAHILEGNRAIRLPILFEIAVRLGKGSVIAGPYLLPQKENVFALAYRVSYGKLGLSQIKVTIPEGTSVNQAAQILKNALGIFDSEAFIALAKPDEGYLFPDTYFFLPGSSPQSVIQAMKDDFEKRVDPALKDTQASGRSESDIVTMASLLEKEARQSETRRIIAGILWKRISLGMPLQVDATFGYIFDRDTYEPAAADKLVDSPYNTYKYRGLPPGPINNPGLEAIEDSITPIATPYLYYVTDKEGNIYYAKTYVQHLLNIQKAKKV